MNLPEERIAIEQLRVGLYVRLESWMQHPFLFSSFKIRSEKQVQALRALGLKEIIYVPGRSDVAPGPPPAKGGVQATEPPPEPSPKTNHDLEAMWAEKLARRQKVAERRAAIVQCERRFNASVTSVKTMLRGLFAKPKESVEQAKTVVAEMVGSLLSEKEVVIHLMSSKSGDENAYYHALNVTVLSLLLAKEGGYSPEEMHDLGVGALLHDIGKERIPSKILMKREPWTAAEQNFYQQHVMYGMELAQKLPDVPPGALEVIACHHEMLDGSGFPARLRGERIGRLARVTAITNSYDNLCNRVNPADSMTPAEALSFMFKKQREKYDPVLLKLFIHNLGIYPPGSIVQLNNDAIGIVTSVNYDRLLQPTLLLYDPEVPKEEAIIFDLEDEPDLAVVRTLRPSSLPPQVYGYLNPRVRINYYMEQGRDRKP